MSRFFTSLLEHLRGGLSPRQTALAVALGLLAGFLTGWNLCLVAVLLAAILLNVPLKAFCQCWALGIACSWLMTPLSVRAGHLLLERTPLGSWFAPMHEHPLFVALDLDRYAIVGGLLCGGLLAAAAGWFASRLAAALHARMQTVHEAARQNPSHCPSFKLRAACRMVFGEVLKPNAASPPKMMRRRGLTIALGALSPLLGGGYSMGPGWIERGVLHSLSAANCAEVNASDVRLSLITGRLEMRDLQVADPQRLDRDRLRARYVSAQIKPGPLLRGRIQIERLLLEEVDGDVARRSRAECLALDALDLARFASARNVAPDAARDGSCRLQDCLDNWDEAQIRLGRLQELLARIEELARADGSRETTERTGPAASVDFASLRAQRCSFGRAQPRVLVQLAAIRDLSPSWGLGADASVELANLSSDPRLTGRPTLAAISAPAYEMEMAASLNLHQPGSQHEFRITAEGLELTRLVAPEFAKSCATVQEGRLKLVGKGWGDSRQFEMQLRLATRNLNAEVTAAEPLAGRTADAWNRGLRQTRRLEAEAVLYGNWTSPRFRIDGEKLAASLNVEADGPRESVAGNPPATPPATGRVPSVPVEQFAPRDDAPQQSVGGAELSPDRLVDSPPAEIEIIQGGQRVDAAEQRQKHTVIENPPVDAVVSAKTPTPDATLSNDSSAPSREGRASPAQESAAAALMAASSPSRAPHFVEESRERAAAPGTSASAEKQTLPTSPSTAIAAEAKRTAPKLLYPESLRALAVDAAPATTAVVQEQQPRESLAAASAAKRAAATSPAPQQTGTAARFAEGMRSAQSAATSTEPNIAKDQNAAIESLPLPAGLELGYAPLRRPKKDSDLGSVAAKPTAPVTAGMHPNSFSSYQSRRQEPVGSALPQSVASAPAIATSVPVDPFTQHGIAVRGSTEPVEPPSMGARMTSWSRGVASRVKGLMPARDSQSLDESASDVVIASDSPPSAVASANRPTGEGGAVRTSAAASEATTANRANAPANAIPWYQRFWR